MASSVGEAHCADDHLDVDNDSCATTIPKKSDECQSLAHNTSIDKSPGRLDTSMHFLLLLSDSALPLGSFAFSSGLESYQAHLARGTPPNFSSKFLPLSLSSYASTSLPFVLACHRNPSTIEELDDLLDAATLCMVGRRASITQGRALLSIWDRSFAPSLPCETATTLREYRKRIKASDGRGDGRNIWSDDGGHGDYHGVVSGHLAPLFGAITRLVGLSLHQAAYTFLLSHVKAVTSAAVRANIVGPYQAQKVLGSVQVQSQIAALITREWDTPVEYAAQESPVLDLWMGRHELLYSRIFNS